VDNMAKIENITELACKKYNCFSQRLSHAIQMELGQMPVNKFKHTNGKIVNVFIMNPKLSVFLTEWSKNKPKKENDV